MWRTWLWYWVNPGKPRARSIPLERRHWRGIRIDRTLQIYAFERPLSVGDRKFRWEHLGRRRTRDNFAESFCLTAKLWPIWKYDSRVCKRVWRACWAPRWKKWYARRSSWRKNPNDWSPRWDVARNSPAPSWRSNGTAFYFIGTVSGADSTSAKLPSSPNEDYARKVLRLRKTLIKKKRRSLSSAGFKFPELIYPELISWINFF